MDNIWSIYFIGVVSVIIIVAPIRMFMTMRRYSNSWMVPIDEYIDNFMNTFFAGMAWPVTAPMFFYIGIIKIVGMILDKINGDKL